MFSKITHIRHKQSTLVAKYTISPIGVNLHSLIMDCTCSSSKIESLPCFSLTQTMKKHYALFWNFTPLYDMLIRLNFKRASRWTSFTSFFLSSSTWDSLPIDNMLRAYATTFLLMHKYYNSQETQDISSGKDSTLSRCTHIEGCYRQWTHLHEHHTFSVSLSWVQTPLLQARGHELDGSSHAP